jgi:hypothetical protein
VAKDAAEDAKKQIEDAGGKASCKITVLITHHGKIIGKSFY